MVTLLLVVLFFAAHVIGLAIVDGYLMKEEVVVDGVTVTNITWGALPYGVERPDVDEKTSYLPVFAMILIATGVLFLVMKLRFFRVWNFWFFISVWLCLTIALRILFGETVALIAAGVLALAKVWWRQPVLHNFTELFLYGGLAAVFVPFLNLWSVSILLLLVSAYDAIAVWGTKHMVALAQFQSHTNLFAGFLIPYGKDKRAVLGGGDIGFTLFFSGVILKTMGWTSSLMVSGVITLALLLLLVQARKNTYYPAMPFLTAGCFVGLLLVHVI
jgi:presenilin-like A22 family membrane protease